MTSTADWNLFCARRESLQLPLRPDGEIAARLGTEVVGRNANVLMLGLTPEISGIGEALTIVDWNEQMLAQAWPADRSGLRAVQADWREMSFPAASFTAVIGDGSLSMVSWPDDYPALFDRLAACLAPGARLALRCFLRPDRPETLVEITKAAMLGEEPSFHALKWRIAMALAGQSGGNIAVVEIYRAFERCFADRQPLASATGWSLGTIAEIDSYRASGATYSFITAAQLRDSLPAGWENARFVSSGDYPLSERCPFLIAEFGSDA